MRSVAMFGVRRSGNHALQESMFKESEGGLLYNDKKFPVRLGNPSKVFGDGNGLLIVSFEDQPVQPHRFDETVVLVRSAYNAFASRLCATTQLIYHDRINNFEEAMKAWKDHVLQDYILFEDLDLSEVRKHRPSFEGEEYNTRWKRVGECKWQGWNQYWRLLLADNEIRELHEEVYGWALTKDGAYYSSEGTVSALRS